MGVGAAWCEHERRATARHPAAGSLTAASLRHGAAPGVQLHHARARRRAPRDRAVLDHLRRRRHADRHAARRGEPRRTSPSPRSPTTSSNAVSPSRTSGSGSTTASTSGRSCAPSGSTPRRASVSQGGSTITQQLVKTLLLDLEQTLDRKIQEAALAWQLEDRYTKERILELYLNTIYFGNGAYGVAAAASEYFGKPVGALTVAEGALLAGLIQAPSDYDPYDAPDAAIARRDVVLDAMLDQDAARRRHVRGRRRRAAHPRRRGPGPRGALPRRPLRRGGQAVDPRRPALRRDRPRAPRSSSSPAASRSTPRSTSACRRPPRRPWPRSCPTPQRSRGRARRHRAVHRARAGHGRRPRLLRHGRDGEVQPGHGPGPAHRLGVQAARAGRRPAGRHPARRRSSRRRARSSSPTAARLGRGTSTTTARAVPGVPVDLVEATVRSYNTVFAQLILEVGAERAVDVAASMGITTPMRTRSRRRCSAPTTCSPSRWPSAYATLANRGVHVDPVMVTSVVRADGTILYEAEHHQERVLDTVVADRVTSVLEQVIARGTGTAAQIGRPAAGKTGTAQEWQQRLVLRLRARSSRQRCGSASPVGEQLSMAPPRTPIRVTGGSYPARDLADGSWAPPPTASSRSASPRHHRRLRGIDHHPAPCPRPDAAGIRSRPGRPLGDRQPTPTKPPPRCGGSASGSPRPPTRTRRFPSAPCSPSRPQAAHASRPAPP